MPQLLIKIKDKIAKPLNNCVICDNSDYTVKFIFDEEWEKEPLRIARFIWNKQYVDVQFTGDTCEVPVVSKTNNLAIGVYAGNLRTTTPAILTCYTSILSEDVIEHSVTPSEYEEIMKLLNAQATDITALKAVDKKIWTNLDTINRTASAAKVKAEEGVAKADNALTATRTNATNITNLQTDVTDLIDEKNTMGSRLTAAENTLNNVKTTAETAETKADSALARNIFTDEEKAKLANITNPIIIKGRVDTAQDLPTEAKIGWFYFVGLENASSYEEYCYSEKGWEYIGLSKEGVDLSDYYTKEQIDTTVNELKAIDNSLGTRIDNVDSKASAAKIKAEEGVAKADNALTKASSNTTDINSLKTDVNALKTVDTSLSTRIDNVDNKASTAKTKAEEGVTKADNALAATRTNATDIDALETDVNALKAVDERIWTNLDTINRTASTAKTKAEEGVAKADDALAATRTNANKIKAHASDIAINHTTLGTQCKNLLNETEYLSSITSVSIGTFNISGNSITLTATGKDCYTKPHTSSDGGYRIPVEPDTDYILSWESDNTYAGLVYAFLNGDLSQQRLANNKDTKYLKFTTKSDTTFITIRLGVATSGNSITYSNIMLRYADITDDTYEPYKESIDERLIENKSHAAVNRSTLGYQCKNLLKNTASTQTINGITFTVNDDKSITANGTATAMAQITIGSITKNGNYRLTGCPAGGSAATYMLSLAYHKVSGSTTYGDETGNGRLVTFDSEKYTRINIRVQINKGVTVSNVTFYPMLRDADITDSTYEPYQPSLVERCLLKDTAGINLGHAQSSSITIDNLPSYTALWVNVSGNVAGINFKTNLIVPVAYLAKSTSNSLLLAGGIPSSAYTTSAGVLAAKNMDGTITAKVNGNTLDLTIGTGTIGSVEVVSLV